MEFNLEEFLKSGSFFRQGADQWVIGWGHKTEYAEAPSSKAAFYITDFFLKEPKPWVVYEHTLMFSTRDFQKILEFDPNPQMRSTDDLKQLIRMAQSGGAQLASWTWEPASREVFASSFERIQADIKNDVLQKAVPLVWERASEMVQPQLLKKIIHKLLSSLEGLTPYGTWSEEGGIIGVTPEVLFSVDENELTTMALAGTQKSEETSSLLEDPKERFEHQLVVDSIAEKLKPMGGVVQSAPYEWDIGLLSHLRTDVTVKLQDEGWSWSELIRTFHPTPALGTFPSHISLEWLQQEPSSKVRKKYGAPFGFVSAEGKGQFFVAIRNLQWAANEAYIFSGCGIVQASELEKEWQELYAKRMSVKHQLGL